MSQDTTDLLKVLAVTLLVFAGGTLVMLYTIFLLAHYGANLPMVGALPLAAPPEMLPLLAQSQVFSTLAAVHVTSMGIALLLTSTTIDAALLIAAKAVTVVITAMLGFAVGHMVYLQLTESTPLNLNTLAPALLLLLAFFVLSTLANLAAFRRLGNLRFVVGVGLVVLGPLLLVWL